MNYVERWPDNKPGRASVLREGRFLLSSPALRDCILFQQWKKKEEKKKTIFCCFVRLQKIAYGLLPIAIGIHQPII